MSPNKPPKSVVPTKQDEYNATRLFLMQFEHKLTDALLDVVWRQWSTMGNAAVGGPTKSIIDPEALVLITISLIDTEPRLNDLVHDWLAISSDLLSTQRIKNLRSSYPVAVHDRLPELAASAVARGKDARWKAIAAERADDTTDCAHVARSNKVRATRPRFAHQSTLMLRLRLAFGVGIKADSLCMLLGFARMPTSVRVAATALGYTASAVRRSVEEMAEARILQTIEGPPLHYRPDANHWQEVLQLAELPLWNSWHERFTFVAAFLELTRTLKKRSVTPYAMTSTYRELFERHKSVFMDQQQVPPWDDSTTIDEWNMLLLREIDALANKMRSEV